MNKIEVDLPDRRPDYGSRPLQRDSLNPDPVAQFHQWFEEASGPGVAESNAMSIATVDGDGRPSLRMVLLKHYDAAGFVFYTNLESRKAREISTNGKVALLFFWQELHRQVRIEGIAERVSIAETLRYFLRRPRDSQLGAWVSNQSQVISSRQVLEQKFAEMKRKFSAGEVPLPSFWGGYRVRPTAMEFWQGRENRLHDRFLYSATGTGDWAISRLAP
jgi:pyridoxamine 5'-phosphate oxidase